MTSRELGCPSCCTPHLPHCYQDRNTSRPSILPPRVDVPSATSALAWQVVVSKESPQTSALAPLQGKCLHACSCWCFCGDVGSLNAPPDDPSRCRSTWARSLGFVVYGWFGGGRKGRSRSCRYEMGLSDATRFARSVRWLWRAARNERDVLESSKSNEKVRKSQVSCKNHIINPIVEIEYPNDIMKCSAIILALALAIPVCLASPLEHRQNDVPACIDAEGTGFGPYSSGPRIAYRFRRDCF